MHLHKAHQTVQRLKRWDSQLEHLKVQSKCMDISALESDDQSWNHIISSLPSGQLLFLLRMISDTRPPMLPSLHAKEFNAHAHAKFNAHVQAHGRWSRYS